MLKLKRVFAAILLAGVLSLSSSAAFAGPGEVAAKNGTGEIPGVTLQDPDGDDGDLDDAGGPGETPARLMVEIIKFLATNLVA